jgi:hypothetical protein
MPDVLAQVWAVVRRLHGAGIAHGQVDAHRLLVTDEGEIGIVDFRGATVAATESRRRPTRYRHSSRRRCSPGPTALSRRPATHWDPTAWPRSRRSCSLRC